MFNPKCQTCEPTTTLCIVCASNYINENGICIPIDATINTHCTKAYQGLKKYCYQCNSDSYKFTDEMCFPPHTHPVELDLGLYLNTTTYILRVCDMSCYTCVNYSASTCDKCRTTQMIYEYRTITTATLFQCVDICPVTTYPTTDATRSYCSDCNSLCYECYNASNTDCTSCQGRGLEFEDISITHTCLSKCPTHHYTDAIGCELCHEYCNECYGGHNYECYDCWPGYYELEDVLLTSTCVQVCPTSFYLKGMRCLRCHPFCLDCFDSGNTKCYECSSIAFAVEDVSATNTCVNKCPYHYYFKLNYCTVCDDSCGWCYGPGNEKCSTCAESYKKLYIDNILTCVKACPKSYFYRITLNECLRIFLI